MTELDYWREVAAAPRGVQPGGDARSWTVARLVSPPDPDTNRAVVSINGSAPVALPYLPNVYEGVNTVYVALDPLRSGSGQMILGPCGEAPDLPEPSPTPAPAPPDEESGDPVLVTARATIFPTATGTYRTIRGAWRRWTGGSGHVTDLYQGNGYGSGPVKGLAVYGSQVAALGATSILAMTVQLVRVATGANSPAAFTVQGSTHGSIPSGAPSSDGETASVSLARFGSAHRLALTPAMCEAFRVGHLRGLALVGSTYGGVKGTTHPAGMVLNVTYTKAT